MSASLVTAPFALLLQPRRGWADAAKNAMPDSVLVALMYPLMMALIPAIAWHYGVTQTGWSIGSDTVTRLTPDSALPIIVSFYFTMVLAVAGIGYMIHWMAQTYGAVSTVAKGIAFAGFTATPLFIAGVVGFYPAFLFDLIIGLLALTYSVYLLYIGIPIVMNIPSDRGFLFASAVIAVCLVFLIAIMGGAVILWDMGAAPVFTD
ncbi:MAG: Yip1 family protein [Spongiibacteraceae bacterium]